MILKAIICKFKGHEVDPDENIVDSFNSDNWVCKCHRCGLYVIHDGMLGASITVTKREAFEFKESFESEMSRYY